MKKLIIIVLITTTLIIALLISGYLLFGNKSEVSKFSGQYRKLAQQCLQKESFGCCIASVHAMANGNYKLMQDNKCEDGFTPDMLLCIDSFKWCVPIKK